MLTTLQCNVVIKKNYFYKLYKKKQYCNYSVIQSVRFTNNCVGMYQLIITLNIIYGTRVYAMRIFIIRKINHLVYCKYSSIYLFMLEDLSDQQMCSVLITYKSTDTIGSKCTKAVTFCWIEMRKRRDAVS